MKTAKRILCLLLLLTLFILPARADERPFVLRSGDPDVPKIAITMDDCFQMEHVREAFEVCNSYGVVMTFFPLGSKLFDKDADFWREVAASGCEIGSHTYAHLKMGKMDRYQILSSLGRTQERLDALLGYHYGIRSVRVPYGTVSGPVTAEQTLAQLFAMMGYEHEVNWTISQTDPKKLLPQVKNGSIMLFHAHGKDVRCIRTIIPVLLEQGYEFVTISDLLGFGELQTSDELYVYDKTRYMRK